MSSILWYAFSTNSAFIISIFFGFYIYKNNKVSPGNIWYALVCFCVGIFCFDSFLIAFVPNPKIALFMGRLLFFGPIFSSVCYLNWVYELTGTKSEKTHAFRKYVLVGGVILTILSLSPFFITGIDNKHPYIKFLIPGPLYYLFIGFIVTNGVVGLDTFIRSIRRATGTKKTQLIYVSSATFVMYLGLLSYLFFVFKVGKFLPLGDLFSIVSNAVITYAIVRHQLMDIEVIIKKTLVFAGLLASVLGIIILPTLIIQEYLVRHASFGVKLFGLSISGIIIIFSTRRIEKFLVNITDKFLFQKRYDYKHLLRTFTQDVLTVLDLNRVLSQTVEKLIDIVKISNASIVLYDEENEKFNLASSKGIVNNKFSISKPNSLLSFFDMTGGHILKTQEGPNSQFPDDIKNALKELEADFFIPLILRTKLIGFVSLGMKKSDEPYSQDDIDILLPLAGTLAIAISNAKLLVQLSRTQAEAAQREKMAVIGTLSAGINHEICNPLGIARGQCEAYLLNMRDGLYKNKTSEELLKKAEDIMKKVIHETDRATVITKKLSSFAKPAKGDMQVVNIDDEIDEVLGLVSYELRLEKIEIEKKFIGNDLKILADKKQVQEIFFNVIRNAGQAIGEKGKITISAKSSDDKVVIDIKDTGHGIPADKIKELFNPFFTTKEPGKGTGLGLFIVRQVVERNGGRIYLKETKVGEGTTFALEFPVAAEAKSHI
ncbi:ATP-binding protein [Candidatus Omnitrophota bacterium]